MPLTNVVLGVAVSLIVTNPAPPAFQEIKCEFYEDGHPCPRIHHYAIIEQFKVIKSTVVPSMVEGRLHHIPVGESTTNLIGIYTTNTVEHPAVYKPSWMRAMEYPPLPPDPKELFERHRQINEAARRAGTNDISPRETQGLPQMHPVPSTNSYRGNVVPPKSSRKIPMEVVILPRRSNTRQYVPPPESK